jgi:uncharacterized protein YciI
MPLFLVIRQQGGPLWRHDRPLEQQHEWRPHADFMDALAADGVILLAGPFGGGGEVLLVMKCDTMQQVHDRLTPDPWTQSGQLTTTRVEPWTVRLGNLEPG